MRGFLGDTNLFLEVLLNQEQKSEAKKLIDFLVKKGRLFISDFAFHTIGIKIWKTPNLSMEEKENVWRAFVHDTHKIPILSLSPADMLHLADNIKNYNLDFDDAYHLTLAVKYGLNLISNDSDFGRVDIITVYTISEALKYFSL